MMGKLGFLLVSLTVGAAFVLHGSSRPNDSDELVVEMITSYGLETESDTSSTIIGLIWYPTIDQEGNIYFLDFQAMEVVSFSNSGELRWKVGSRGDGPEELTWPHGLIWDGEQLVLLNQPGARIDRLDADGNWLDPIRPRTSADGAIITGILNDSLIVTQRFREASIGAAFTVRRRTSWEAVGTFSIDFDGEVDGLTGQLNLMPPTGIYDGHIAVGSYSTDAFYLYDREGKLARTVTPDRYRLLRPIVWENQGTKMLVKFNRVSPPIRVGEDLSLVRYSLPPEGIDRNSATPAVERRLGEEFRRDFYDNAGKLIASYGSDTPEGNLLHGTVFAVQGDYVYLSKSRPAPHLVKLRIRRTK